MGHRDALLATLESMNFTRRGVSPSMHMMNTLVPFFNAQVQGLDLLYRSMTGKTTFDERMKVQSKMKSRGLMLAATTMAYAMAMGDDEAYKNAPAEVRYGNFFIPFPGLKEPLKVPVPFEIGYIFKSIPEMVFNVALKDEKAEKAIGALGKLMYQSVPSVIPQAAKPLLEAKLGRSFYTGRDIESQFEKSKIATERTRDTTSYAGKKLSSDTLNVSPVDIDYLINGYTGAAGLALVRVLSGMFEPPRLSEMTGAQIESPEKRTSEMPFVGSLFQPRDGVALVNDAYKAIDEFAKAKTTFNDLVKQGRRSEALEFAQQYQREIALADVGNKAKTFMSQIADIQRMVRISTDTPAIKREKLDKLQRLKIEYARNFTEAVD
jgi:hypothetical protein